MVELIEERKNVGVRPWNVKNIRHSLPSKKVFLFTKIKSPLLTKCHLSEGMNQMLSGMILVIKLVQLPLSQHDMFFLNCCFFSKYYFVIFFLTYFLNAKIRCTLFACVWRPTFWSVAAALQMCGELREIAKYIYLNLLHVQIFVVILSLFSSRRLWCAALAKRFKVKWMKWIFILPDLLKNYLHSLLWLLLWRIISSRSVNVIFFPCCCTLNHRRNSTALFR